MNIELQSSGEIRSQRTNAFTMIELLVVISIIGLIASLLVGLAPLASRRMKETKVRAELQELITLIDSYKAKYGVYPPDGIIYTNGVFAGSDAIHPLFYELSGVIAYVPELMKNPPTPTGYYLSPLANEKLTQAAAQGLFHRDGIINAVPADYVSNSIPEASTVNRARLLRHEFKAAQYTDYTTNGVTGAILLVGIPWPANDPNQPLPDRPGLNPWHYVSSQPVQNPNSYDLWANIKAGKQIVTIGNWKNSQ